jgi:serine/threonine protein kinase
LRQCQTDLGPGHINLINVYEVILTPDHLALVMEYAEGGSLTAHVAERWGTAKPGGLIMDEDEARYIFRVHTLSAR